MQQHPEARYNQLDDGVEYFEHRAVSDKRWAKAFFAITALNEAAFVYMSIPEQLSTYEVADSVSTLVVGSVATYVSARIGKAQLYNARQMESMASHAKIEQLELNL